MFDKKEQIINMLNKYYKKIGRDIIDAEGLYCSLIDRFNNGSILFLSWNNFNGFLTCDFQLNPIKQRLEGIVWTVYNPDPKYKAKVLNFLEIEAKKRQIDSLVFFAENPEVFNRLVKSQGYEMTLGYFEKDLRGKQ